MGFTTAPTSCQQHSCQLGIVPGGTWVHLCPPLLSNDALRQEAQSCAQAPFLPPGDSDTDRACSSPSLAAEEALPSTMCPHRLAFIFHIRKSH